MVRTSSGSPVAITTFAILPVSSEPSLSPSPKTSAGFSVIDFIASSYGIPYATCRIDYGSPRWCAYGRANPRNLAIMYPHAAMLDGAMRGCHHCRILDNQIGRCRRTLCVAATVAATESAKTPAIVDTGANRRIEELIRDYLLRKKAKRNGTIVACSSAERESQCKVSDQTFSFLFLQRNISMLLGRIFVPLRRQHIQRSVQPSPRLARPYDGIDVSSFSGDIRIRKPLTKFLDLFLTSLRENRQLLFFRKRLALRPHRLSLPHHDIQLPLIDDIHRTLRPHHRNLRRRPRQIHVRAQMFRTHHAIRPAIRLARNHRKLRHRGLCECIQQLRAVADDTAMLLLNPRHESRHIFERNQRNIEGIAETHKTCALHAGIDIQYSSEERGLIAHNPNSTTSHANKANHDVPRKVLLPLK